MKVKQIIKLIEEDGWQYKRTKGSHRVYKHSTKPGVVVVPGKLSKQIAIGTEISILKQAKLK